MTRVLIVDDSPTVRALLVQVLGADPQIRIVGCAADGEEALRLAASARPEVITMDLHMPNMDGCEATRRIMQAHPVPIVVVSGADNALEVDAGFRAIEAGALAIAHRPAAVGHPDHAEQAQALRRTVKSMAEVKVVRRWTGGQAGMRAAPALAPRGRPRLVALGASTGGPAVLRDILAQLGPDFPLPLVIVQHMAAGFTAALATWLGAAAGFPVRVAADDERLAAGCAWLAPDGRHLGVTRELRACLSDRPPEHGMRPAVSQLFRSIPAELRGATLAVLLTGMGKDGAEELRRLRDDGAVTIAQDRASSAVHGMPGEAIARDAAMLILDPVEIGKTLQSLAAGALSPRPFLGANRKQ